MSSKAKPVKKAGVPRKKAANGYKLPDPIPNGEVLQDISKKKWKIGPSIGVGGFGEIYSACEFDATPKKSSLYPYVIKIEPHGNGPLFVEMHFYMRNAKKDDVQNFMKSHKLSKLGMPLYLGSGSHECNGQKYRFVVMERFGQDLWHKFLESGRQFPPHTVFRIAIQLLDVLEYIHSRTYVHADIKGGNILFGTKKGSENQVYLVDFGLASHYTIKDYCKDPKKAHNGTIEYTSRDAHNGVPTRRSDMEILGYNLVQWLAGSLPWEDNLTNLVYVQQQKEKYMSDIQGFMNKTFIKSKPPAALVSYLQYVSKMEYDSVPEYDKCRQFFVNGIKSLGYSVSCDLDFTPVKAGQRRSLKREKVTQDADQEDDLFEESDSENLLVPKRISKAVKKVVKNARSKRISTSPSNEVPIKKSKRSLKVDIGVKSTPDKKMTNTIATQTSLEKPKDLVNDNTNSRLDKDSTPRARRNIPVRNYLNSSQSSVDVIEDSFTDTPPVKRVVKKKHTKKLEVEYGSDEEVTIQTTIKKIGTPKKEVRSWKNCAAVINGITPKKEKL